LSELGCGELVKKTFFYPRSGMDPCKYCSEVFQVQTESGLGQSGYVSGRNTSPEPEIGVPSNKESEFDMRYKKYTRTGKSIVRGN